MTEKLTAYLTGRTYWFKGLGDPRMNEYAGERMWTFDLEVTPETEAWLKEHGLLDKIKKTQDGTVKKTPDGKKYISFKKKEFTRDGKPSAPWRVVGPDGSTWSSDSLIGNGSVIRVKVNTEAYKMGGRTVTGLYAQAIQVGEHVQYVSNEFEPWEGASETPAPKTVAKALKPDPIEELTDDNPFDE
jgi:hypothetical protein